MRAIAAIGLAVVVGIAPLGCDMTDDDVGTDDSMLGEPTDQDQTDPQDGDAGIAALQVDSLDGEGEYLTDANGRALYLLEGEPQDSSTCYDECAEEWPPYLTSQEAPTGGDAVQQNLVGTVERSDGATDGQWQVTYAGQPLYYYHDDVGPGETAGQDVTDDWGEWYLVQPDGEPLEANGDDDGDTDT